MAKSKLSDEQKEIVLKRHENGDSNRKIAKDFNVSYTTIARILNPDYAERVREVNRKNLKSIRDSGKLNSIQFPPLILHPEKDADIITKLNSVSNRQGYIKKLIREDILKNS